MKYPVRRRLAAQESLERIAIRIAEHDLEAAYRFVDAVEASLSLLSEMPGAGPTSPHRAPHRLDHCEHRLGVDPPLVANHVADIGQRYAGAVQRIIDA